MVGVLVTVGVFVKTGVLVVVDVLVAVMVFVTVGELVTVMVFVGVIVLVGVEVPTASITFSSGSYLLTVCPFFVYVVILVVGLKLIVQPANFVSCILGRITKCKCGPGCSFPVHTCTVILSAITANFWLRLTTSNACT